MIPSNRIVILQPTKLSASGRIQVVEKDTPEIGKVIAVGQPGYFDNSEPRAYPITMEIGDTVAYRRYGESKFFIAGQETVFVSFDDILAVIKE